MRIFLPLAVGLLCASLSHPSLAQFPGSGGFDFDVFPPCMPAGFIRSISTDPQGPPYNPDPTKINTFNWYEGPHYGGRQYALNSPAINQATIWLPWEQPDNSNVQRILGRRDRPVDGWELVRRNLGYDNAGNPVPDTYNPYIILYNRYQGMLRVFVAIGDLKPNFRFAEIKLRFNEAAAKKAGTLNRQAALGVALEDTEPGPGGEFVAIATYLNDRSKWFMADFPMDYDPCVCLFDSKLKIEVNLISEANVRLIGETAGTLVTTGGNNLPSTGPSYDKGIPFIRKFNSAVSAGGKTYDNIDKLTTALTGKKGANSGALGALNAAAKKSDFLKAGLGNLPWIGSAVGLLDFFLTGGKDESAGPLSLQPMTIEMSTTTTGTISATSLYAFTAFHNPGNRISTTIPEESPFYNEAMGVFSLLKKPVIEYKAATTYNFPDRSSTTIRSFRLAENLQYVINPASGLEVQDFQVAIVLAGRTDLPPIVEPSPGIPASGAFETREGQMVQPNGSTLYAFRTNYFDAACIKNNVLESAELVKDSNPYFGFQQAYLKVMLNLRVFNGAPTQQNVLYVARYPVTLNTVSDFPSLPYAQCGVLPQARPSAIRAVCNGTKYQQAITLPRPGHNGTITAHRDAEGQLQAYPNPATGSVRLRYQVAQPGRVRLTLSDALGREVRTILDQEQAKAGTFEVTAALTGLRAGIYFCNLRTNSQHIVEKIVITD